MTAVAALSAAAPSPELAGAANLVLYSAMAVFTVAMLLFAAYLAALGPAPSRRTAPAKALVTVGAGSGGHGDADPPSPADAALDADGPSLRARKLAGSAVSMTWLATVLLVGSIALRGLSVMRPPWGNMFEFATAGAAAAAVGFSVLVKRNRWEWLGLFVVGPVLLTLGTALLAFYTEAAELMPALKSVWLVIHVTVAILATGMFILSFSVGVVYFLKLRREGALAAAGAGSADGADGATAAAEPVPGRTAFLDGLPSSTRLERTAYSLTMIGFILWTFTLVAGAIWAQKAWGAYWTWDPKEVWTFVVWVVYAAYMHARATAGWEPRKAMWIAIAGFLTVIVNFAVVNVFFVGQHSYSGL